MKKFVIKKDDLINNINVIKNYIKEKDKPDDNGNIPKIIAVVKGNAYGLGIVEFCKVLLENDINFFAVATVEEALTLRQAGFDNDILMLSSTSIKEDVEKLIDNNIILTIGSTEAGMLANEIARKKEKIIRAHLKIDTGFGRYGFIYNECDKIADLIGKMSSVKIEGTFTHFSESFMPKTNYSKLQFERFVNCVGELQKKQIYTGILHVCNSCAFFRFPECHLNAVRIGSAFLGRIPIKNEYGLKKVGSFETVVTEIKDLPKGFNIGYGSFYKTKRKVKVATIPVGYKDGFAMHTKQIPFRFVDFLRDIKENLNAFFKKDIFNVKINDTNYDVIGVVGMYNTELDITNKDIKIGDKVNISINPIYLDTRIEREYI